jgi:hypothetical protein
MSELPEWAKPVKIGDNPGTDYYFKPNLGIKIKAVSLTPGKSNKSVETLQHIINFILDEDIDFDTEWGTYGEKTITGLKRVHQPLLGTYASFTSEEFKYFLEDFGIELV